MTITSVLSARDKIDYGLGDMASALLGMALLLIFYKLNSQTADRVARELARKRDLNNAGESLSSPALNNAIQE
ncbi:hypothetical protein [Citrobacter sedlakii]|uniref:hypothetical protein n=1 Tax=Citrobacter sedlakii TaxID=67826 RepID=UPI001BA8249E|nr:hypothetical protein [Citrobacter sedlakii]EKJ8220061.1 hypothetical protein [Citrobacter sedlakii]QUC32467.1 hypothetical protein JY391_12075 [Citrobacter sedlakii]